MTEKPIKPRMARPRKEIDTSTYSGRFAVRLRALRDKTGMTVTELSVEAGIPASTLQTWEIGQKSPTIEKLPSLAKALGVPIEIQGLAAFSFFRLQSPERLIPACSAAVFACCC